MSIYRNFVNFKRKLKKQGYTLMSVQQLLNYKGEDIPAHKVRVIYGHRIYTFEGFHKVAIETMCVVGQYLEKIIPEVAQTVGEILTTAFTKQIQALHELQENLKNGG